MNNKPARDDLLAKAIRRVFKERVVAPKHKALAPSGKVRKGHPDTPTPI